MPVKPGSTLIFGTALLESLVFEITKYYWMTKSCKEAGRALLHNEVRFSIFDRMNETCCRLRPLEGSGDKSYFFLISYFPSLQLIGGFLDF